MADGTSRFNRLVAKKVALAEEAMIGHLTTLAVSPTLAGERTIGNVWTHEHYDGSFHLADLPEDIPATSLVFVESRDGDTDAVDPDTLGGGAIDKHLIYEGLSRVAADAVLTGASTARSVDTFFSVWHPQLVALRESLGLPRHPVQIMVSNRGEIDLSTVLFNVPSVPVIVLAGAECRRRWTEAFESRPWLTVVPLAGRGLAEAFEELRRGHGIRRISAVGGRRTATALVDAGLVQDVLLTTTNRRAGRPGTPFYSGATWPRLDPVVTKTTESAPDPIVFRRLLIRADRRSSASTSQTAGA